MDAAAQRALQNMLPMGLLAKVDRVFAGSDVKAA